MHQSGSSPIAIAFLLLACACSGAQDGESALDEAEGARVANTEQGIGESTCATAARDALFNTNYNQITPPVYGKVGCTKAFIVDARSLVRPPRKLVQWAGPTPTTPAACTAAFVTSTFYVLRDGQMVQSGAPRSDTGNWVNGACQLPIVQWSDKPDLVYRTVSAARLTADPAAPTRSLRVYAGP